jgi:NAD(P)H-dependent flavin oxidoreductase YrpB (nitropropane dioxygenase family)
MTKVLPQIIQGGMGVAVSNWKLAKAVSQHGGMGVVSGTAIDAVLIRRLESGDEGGDVRRALAAFPNQETANHILEKYFIEGGKAADVSYSNAPKLLINASRHSNDLLIVGAFVEVWLAKEGHNGSVGINFLEKIQMGSAAGIIGAMIAKVDYVIMGAGIPREIPRFITEIAQKKASYITIDIVNGEAERITLDPAEFIDVTKFEFVRPMFLAIIISDILAAYLARDESSRPDGFIIEGPSAGGHNAPPRGKIEFDADNEPIYGPRDLANLEKMQKYGYPYWLAGGFGARGKLQEALDLGAVGVQVGTLFALCSDSGFTDKIRNQILDTLRDGTFEIHTDMLASPTGFPIKIVSLPGTTALPDVFAARPKLCDMGYLREPIMLKSGRVDYRCPSEPEKPYLKKDGTMEETVGRKCLCNGLFSNIGLGQHRRDGYDEAPIVTLGSDVDGCKELIKDFPGGWNAAQALDFIDVQ